MPTGYLLQGAFGLPGLPQQVQGANVQQVTEVGDFLLPWARVREPVIEVSAVLSLTAAGACYPGRVLITTVPR